MYILPRGKGRHAATGADNEYMARSFRLEKNLLKIYFQDNSSKVTILVLNINHVRKAQLTDFEIELHFKRQVGLDGILMIYAVASTLLTGSVPVAQEGVVRIGMTGRAFIAVDFEQIIDMHEVPPEPEMNRRSDPTADRGRG